MPNRDDILRDKTHKDDGVDIKVRIFYMLSDDKSLQHQRNSKALALLVKLLREKGQLSDEEVDDLLLECVLG